MNSPEYEKALEISRTATREYRKAADAYRARTIGDKEHLAARRIYEESQAAFTEAFNAEENRSAQ